MNAQLSRRTFLAASAAATLAACSANPGAQQEAPAKTAKLDPSNPTSVTVWHYYNGAQQAAFDEIVGEFNDGAGKAEGIHVEAQSLGSVSDLESAISDSVAGAVGSRELPGIFSSYSDTAYAAQQKGALANIAQYFTSSELSEFVDGYLQEGCFILRAEVLLERLRRAQGPREQPAEQGPGGRRGGRAGGRGGRRAGRRRCPLRDRRGVRRLVPAVLRRAQRRGRR